NVFGNFTHDDTSVRDVHGGNSQTSDYAKKYGYKLTVTVGMANDYNGYIASYREYMDRDHYRKALTGWGPHSSDYYPTRLTQRARRTARTSAPYVTAEPQVDGTWVPFADQSGAVPVTRACPAPSEGTYDPAAIANGMIGYRAGGQAWKWTASFEAFVSRFPLV